MFKITTGLNLEKANTLQGKTFPLGPTLVLIFPLLFASLTHAQQNSASMVEKWYKVEICVFANKQVDAELSEHWSSNIKLGYPQNIRYLFSPVTINNKANTALTPNEDSSTHADALTDFSSLSINNINENKHSRYIDIDLYPSSGAAAATNSVASVDVEINDEIINPMPHEQGDKIYRLKNYEANQNDNDSFDPESLDPTTITPATSLIDELIKETISLTLEPKFTEQADSDSNVTRPTAFELLDDQQQDLHDAIGKIEGSPYLRVLLHKAWLQPINNKQNATHLALRGGDKYDKHHELEGSIYLYRERYLHLVTNLWLSKLAPNIGQENDAWPMLPPYPFMLQESSTEEFTQHNNSNGNGNEFTLSLTEQLSNDLSGNKDLVDQYTTFLNNQYVTERIVLMSQHRKMRSKELHYIDHPLLGLLIQITPYEPPEVGELEGS